MQPVGLKNNTKLQKVLMIQYQLITHIENLPKRYNEALLEKTELTLKKSKDVMKALNLY